MKTKAPSDLQGFTLNMGIRCEKCKGLARVADWLVKDLKAKKFKVFFRACDRCNANGYYAEEHLLKVKAKR